MASEAVRGTARRRRGVPRVPRGLLWLGTPLLALVLITLFVLGLLPYERLRPRAVAALSAATGARVSLGTLGPGLGWGGPELVLGQLRMEWPDQPVLDFETARLRPAWSSRWLERQPVVWIDAVSTRGSARGVLTLGEAPGWKGRLEGLELGALPLGDLASGAALEGTGDLDGSVRLGEGGPEGALTLQARDGSLALPGLPIAIPYAELQGLVNLGGDALARILSLDLHGPMLDARLSGTVGHGRSLEVAPLDLRLELELRDLSLRPALEPLGLPLDRQGRAELSVGGTLGRPIVR